MSGMISFVHDLLGQRVVFAPGAVARVADEAARLGFNRALVIATPGSGARLGGRLVEILGARAAGLHAQASLHVPKPVAEAGVAAASGMNAIAHCVEGLWVGDRTPFLMALASDAARRFATYLPRVVANGGDREARAECLVAAWLAGVVLASGTGLQHKLAHVLGGLGLPHAEAHAIILPHVARFNLAAAPEAQARLAAALGGDGAERLAALLRGLPIPQRLREVGFDRAKTDFVAQEVAAMSITVPCKVSAEDVRTLLAAAY